MRPACRSRLALPHWARSHWRDGRPAWPDLFWLGDSLSGWLILILLALVPTIVGYGLYTNSLNYLPTNVANLIATLEPVQTTILAVILLGEAMGFAQVWGSVLILGSVVALRIWEVRARPRPVLVK